MKINFICYALLSVDHCDDSKYGDPDSPELLGLYQTYEAATQAAEAIEADRVRKYNEWRDTHPMNIGQTWDLKAPITKYAVVELDNTEVEYLDDLGAMLKESAQLQLFGISI